MSTALIPLEETSSQAQDVLALASACVSRLSPNTQRAYLAPLREYLTLGLPLSREGIGGWLARRKAAGAGAITLNIALAALKLLAREVWIRGLMPGEQYNAISDLRSEKVRGQRLGQWTNEAGIEALLRACETVRERALIAVMAGCGLRRSEVAGLRWDQYREFHGRRVLTDIRGKGGRIRSVAVPEWAREVIDEYREEQKETQ